NSVFAFRARRQERDRASDQFLDAPDIFDGLGRQLRPVSRARRWFLPAVDRFIHRLVPRLRLFAGRKIVDFTAIQPVAHANLDLVEAIEDVELGEREAVNPTSQHSLPHEHGVEPAAAAGAPGHGAELAAPLSERFADRVVHLVGGKRTKPDARRVGLAYTK